MCTGSRLAVLTETREHNTAVCSSCKPLSATEGQRVALMNLGYLTEIRGDSNNSRHIWPEKRKLSERMGTSKKKLPMRFDDGLCE